MSTNGICVHDEVRIVGKPHGDINEFGRVTAIDDAKGIHVSNINMPYCGTVCRWFDKDQVEEVEVEDRNAKGNSNGMC